MNTHLHRISFLSNFTFDSNRKRIHLLLPFSRDVADMLKPCAHPLGAGEQKSQPESNSKWKYSLPTGEFISHRSTYWQFWYLKEGKQKNTDWAFILIPTIE